MESLHINPSPFRKHMGLLREQYAEFEEGLDGNWWADSMECYCYLQSIKNIWDRFNHLVHWLNIILYPRKTQSRTNQFGKNVLPGMLVMYCTREVSGKETYWSWTLRSWKRWTHASLLFGTQIYSHPSSNENARSANRSGQRMEKT